MSDVFLSYNREDQAIAQRFAEGFEREGLSVWWMPTLRSGETYDTVTEKALRQASAVAVLWSRRSVESQWVRAEATIANRGGTFVPVMIEACDRPVAFELTQTADLTRWNGDANDPAWRTYVADVRRVVEHSKQRGLAGSQQEGDRAQVPTLDLEAYGFYLQALTAMGGASEKRLKEAFDLISQAIARDPRFGRAYLVRATISSLRSAPLAEVERDARKALELNPADAAEAQGILATLEARRGNWIAAEELFAEVAKRSLTAEFYQTHTIGTLWPTGQLRKVQTELAEAQRMIPAGIAFTINLGRAYSSLGWDAQAVQYTNLAIAMGADPKSRRTQQALIDAAMRAGRFDEAADRMISTLPASTDAQTRETIRLVYAAMGDRTKRTAALAALKGFVGKSSEFEWVVLVNAMTWYTQLDALDDAYAAAYRLQVLLKPQAVVNPWAWLWNPELRAFRRDARFQPFVTALGMMKYWERYGPPDNCDLKDGKLTCH